MNKSYSTIKMVQDDHPTLDYVEILSIVATVLSICMNLLCCVLDVRTAGSWISDRATRLKQQLKAAFEEEAIKDEPWWFVFSSVSILSLVLGAPDEVAVWIRMPVFCMLFACGVFLLLRRPSLVWAYETIYDWTTWPRRVVDRPSGNPAIEIPTEADVGDRKEMEDKDEELTDTHDTDDTDDTWSSNLDTPSASESESSHPNDTSTSTNNVRTDRAAIQDTSAREATRAGFRLENAASYLEAFFPPPPLDMIILQVKKGVDSRESMLVLMYKTTPFVQLKDKLRKKNEDDSELVVRRPKGHFPLFDNETPGSVSSVHRVLIVVVEEVQTLTFSM
jgi:hypothetical protein